MKAFPVSVLSEEFIVAKLQFLFNPAQRRSRLVYYSIFVFANEEIILVKYKENGIANMLLAALCLATMGALTKILGRRFSSVELVFFRNVIGTTIICISFLI